MVIDAVTAKMVISAHAKMMIVTSSSGVMINVIDAN